MARFVRWTALAAAAALLLGGCSSGSPSDDGKGGEQTSAAASPSTGSAGTTAALPSALTAQKLAWGRCKATADSTAPGNDWQCATLKVPLDWSKPQGETMGLALIRAKARGGTRIGSLLFNFGGPGASGVSLMPAFGPTFAKLREQYDLVSWDPRGVGSSDGIRCRSDKDIQASESVDATPDTPAEEKAYVQDAVDFGKGCEKAAGKLMAHVSTTDTARDMDLMRQVLGDTKMHYFGISYGTELGGVYAHLFPKKVAALVLDAVVDPSADMVGHSENQARGFQRALNDYLKSTGQDPDQGSRKISALLKRIDAHPLPTSTGRRLTQTLALTGLTYPLYSKQGWPSLTSALNSAENGDGSELLSLADGYNGRDTSGHYDTTTHSQRVISCLDSKLRPTPAETKKRLAQFEKISPVFGDFMGWDTAGWCHDCRWPASGTLRRPVRPARPRSSWSATPATRRRRTRAPGRWPTSWARASVWSSPGRARGTVRTAGGATASTPP